MLIIDFETRSRANLPVVGSYNYALDPSTDILCCAFYNVETQHKYVWYPSRGPLAKDMVYHINRADFIVAHHAEFDMAIWEAVAVPDYDFPEIQPEKWYCTSAQCRVNGLPAGLDDAAWALGLKQRKDYRGKALIKALSIPQADGTFNEDPKLMQEMYAYCMQDAVVTAAILESTRLMMQEEHADWLKTVDMNLRGVRIDRELARAAMAYAAEEQAAIGARLDALTDGEITKHTQNARIRNWILDRLPGEDDGIDPVRMAMTVYKDGEKKYSLAKDIRRNLLALADEGHMPGDMAEVIQLLDDGNKSSVAKFGKMLDLADPVDDRVRGAFVYAGATATLRYTSRGLQLHNMRRDCFSPDDAEELRADMLAGRQIDDVMNTLSKMLRPAIIPEKGKSLIVSDWSAIEARILPWLANDPEADLRLEIFKRGDDIYVETAKDIGTDSRQIGKVAELALGFQGAVVAFQSMAKNYGLNISDAEAQKIVDAWGAANQWAVRFWRELEVAAREAMRSPNQMIPAGMVDYVYWPDVMDGTLVCQLPGLQLIQYPKARIEEVETKFGPRSQITALKASFKPKADAKEWPRGALYGGLLAENVTQATAAAILRESVRILPDVIAHVHDEIILEVPTRYADRDMLELTRIMNTPPQWADGLPLAVEASIMQRYGKG
jgi:DNA polymerase